MYDLSKLLNLAGRDSGETTYRAAAVGLVAPLIAERIQGANQTLSWHFARINRALDLNQLSMFFDRFGRLCGYVLWTQVNEDLDRGLLKSGPSAASAIDMSRQGAAWILDMSVMFGELPSVFNRLRDETLIDQESVKYFRFKIGRRIVKQVSRSDRISLFSAIRTSSTPPVKPFLETRRGKHLLFNVSRELDSAIQLGHCLHLLNSAKQYKQMPLTDVLRRVCVPIDQLQSKLYFSPTGLPIGLMTWAWLERDFLNSVSLPALHALAPFEWNAGEVLYVCDALATLEGLGVVRADLQSDWFPTENLWIYPRFPLDAKNPTSTRCWNVSQRAGLLDSRSLDRNGPGTFDLIDKLCSSERKECTT